ncbi:MAG: ABC transporter [Bacteroidetes bacterium RIFOXYB2_FULL_35_7]|nr:MAG: ABC transporter [Bacteroidetes bacterium RIFOXYB2_FULL_35_7]
MNFLSVEELSKSYGTKLLFDKITFGVNQHQRVALVARNGAGKTSLLRILTGAEIADSGVIAWRKDIKYAYLEQDPILDENLSIAEAVYQSDNPVLNAVRAYENALLQFEKNDSEINSKNLQDASSLMDQLTAWDYESKIKEILYRLDIPSPEKKIRELSGGQKKRVALAKILIHEPDMLILDEPTNHLDLEMTEWLEELLISRKITLLLVTHDRYFLDTVCTEIIELEQGKLFPYKGNFQYFIEKKAAREQVENAEIDKARNLYRRELEWVRRMPKARTTKAKYRVDAFTGIQEKAFSKQTEQRLEFNVKMTRIGSKILELKNVSKSYDEICCVKEFSYIFKKGEKIGVIGKNGIGKTTLLNIIMKQVMPDAGSIDTGDTVVYGYYSQGGIKLNEDKKVIEVVKEIAEFIPLSNGSHLSASQMLFQFQFPADVQHSYVSKLSGGEKQKLYLLTVLMKNPNFLILDEPTNDLDIATLGSLEDFLFSFQGCILIVTHDRYFMDKMVDHIFAFEGSGLIRDFPGNYTQYREKIEQEQKNQIAIQKRLDAKENSKAPESPVITMSEKKKMGFKEKMEFEKLEIEIANLEAEKTDLTDKMNMPSSNHEEIIKIVERFNILTEELDQKSMRWLELSELV